MQNKRHKYPFILISSPVIAGIILGRYLIPYPYSFWSTLILFIVSLVCTCFKRTQVLNFALILSLSSAVMLRYHQSADCVPVDHLVIPKSVTVDSSEGMITDYFYRNDERHQYLFQVRRVWFGDSLVPANSKVLLYTHRLTNKFHYGDYLRIIGPLKATPKRRNPGQFDYTSYLKGKKIYYMRMLNRPDIVKILAQGKGSWFMHSILIPLREFCRSTFIQYSDENTAALLLALILGEKQDLDPYTIEQFQKVGVVHVLAISGLHVGFIIAFVFSLLTIMRFDQKSKIWILIVVLILYIILVRFKTPVIRASTMAILYLIGQVLERKIVAINIILAALSLILIIDPAELFRPGLHFSFMAVFSIVYGYPKLDQLLPLNRFLDRWNKKGAAVRLLKKYLWMPFLVSLAAVLGTLPLALFYYGTVPVYAIFANLIVIPLIGAIVFLSIFSLITALISDSLTSGIAAMISVLNDWMQLIIQITTRLPYASWITPFIPLGGVFILYALFILILNLKNNRIYILLLPVGIFLYFILYPRNHPDNRLRVTFLDVGQGDAAFLRFPNNTTMLIDAGDAFKYRDQGAKTVMPFLQTVGNLHITYLVGSHAHNDHIGGFPYLMNHLSIDTLVLSGYRYHSKLFRQLFSIATDKNIPVRIVSRGDQLYPDSSCRVYILHPDSSFSCAETRNGTECNNSSIVLKVQYGENGILFTGDLEQQGEYPLLDFGDFLESEIIKIGHHGSSTSTSANLLDCTDPLLAVISVALKNKFKHPSPRTILRLQKNDIGTYLTSNKGALIFDITPAEITKIAWNRISSDRE